MSEPATAGGNLRQAEHMHQDPPPSRSFVLRRGHVMLAFVLIALLVAVVGGVVVSRRHHHAAPGPGQASETADQPTWEPSQPSLPADVTVSWAYLDSTEGSMIRHGDQDLHPLDQLIAPGAAEDYLNRPDDASAPPVDADLLTSALAGNPDAGTDLVAAAGGAGPVFTRIVDSCQLTDTRPDPPQATALAVAQYAACLREGAITDPHQAGRVLDQMRGTAGGIGDVRGNDGGQRVAQYNSTIDAGAGRMRTGCMAIGAYWSAAVLVDWPAGQGALYGTAACAEVARTEFPPDTQPASDQPAPGVRPEPSSNCPYGVCRGTD